MCILIKKHERAGSDLAAVKRMVIIETITGTVTTVTLDCLMCPTEEVKNLISLLCMNVLVSGRPFARTHISCGTFNTLNIHTRMLLRMSLHAITKKRKMKEKLYHILKISLQSLKLINTP